MIQYVLFFLAGYLPGSIPTAYLLVRRKASIDIRSAGSGNVGGYNTYQVTGSRSLGVVVGLIDGAKGLVAVIGASMIGGEFWLTAVALIGAIIGHNYPVWLKFKGGRGLATAAGGTLPLGVAYAISWCLIWIATKSIGRGILTANIFAILVSPALVFFAPDQIVEFFMTSNAPLNDYRILSILLSIILLAGHVNGLKEVVDDLRGIQTEIEKVD